MGLFKDKLIGVKEMIKKIISTISIIICLTVVMGISASALNVTENTSVAAEKEHDIFIQKQSMSLDTYGALEKKLKKSKDTYGGAYIDDNGDLNICVVDSSVGTKINRNVSEKNVLKSYNVL